MKKTLKWLVIIIGIMYIGAFAVDKMNKKPFRFEDFRSSEELILYINSKFPHGTDSSKLLGELKASGAKCKIIDKKYYAKGTPENCNIMYSCEYNTGWLSYPPLIDFIVTVYENQEGKIITFSVGRQYAGP